MNKSFTKAIIKIFILSFLVVFVGSILSNQKHKISLDFLNKPQIEKDTTMETVKSSLKEKPNKFHLKKQSKIIKSAYADTKNINAASYIIVDYDTGEVIAEKNSNKRLSIASLTKIMTAVVALDLAEPSDKFIISKNSSEQIPTKIGVKVGESLTLDELLSASLLTSANDATEAIMEGIDNKYNRNLFIKSMNLKANLLGLENTSFANPQGFDEEYNFSTAEDLALLSRYALESYPAIREKAAKEYEFLPENSTHKKYDLQNWNGLLGVYPGTFGLKIGNTDDAGRTTVVASKRNNKTLIVVVLGTEGIIERDLAAANLLDYGFEKSAGLDRIAISEEDLRNKYSKWKYW